MAKIKVRLSVRLPWWWRLYFAALWFFELTVGGIDTEIAGSFLAKHTRTEVREIDA